jgi:hypothetical protein
MAWAASLPPAAAFGQSNAGLGHARTSLTSVREYVAAESIPIQLSSPPNLVVSGAYRQIIESMLRGSPTFRRQCLRLAGEPSLTVHVGLAPVSWPSTVRATTRVTRQKDGRLAAHIAIAPNTDVVEMIAHEFEHVIEQIDGVDLAALAARPGTGVHRQGVMPGAFETVRAARVGRIVTGEFLR